MGTEVHADRRTRRRRTRGQDEAAALAAQQRELDEENEAILDELEDVFDDGSWMWDE